jgi:hypothetical protein
VSQSDARAVAKRIGEDAELLVVQLLEDVQLVPDSAAAWYDGIATTALTPEYPIRLGGICVIWQGARIEIKACQVSRSKRDVDSPGLWYFKGRETGQHARLEAETGLYALAVHREADTWLGREIVGLLIVPAATIGDILAERSAWYDSGRHEGFVAQLRWDRLLEEDDLFDQEVV